MTTEEETPEKLKEIAGNWEESFNGHAVELKKKRLLDAINSPEFIAAQKHTKKLQNSTKPTITKGGIN